MSDNGPTSAEMGLTPKDMGIKTPDIHKEVDPQTFQQMKIRIEKSGRIKQDIRPGDGKPFNKARVDEVRDLEQKVNLRDPKPENIDQDLGLDGRGFQQQSYWVSYKSPDGQILRERVVMFAKPGENGQWDFMKDGQGRTMAINGDLFDTKLTSNIHAQGMDYDTFTIPRVDSRGAYSGIITLRTDKAQAGSGEQAVASTPQQTQAEKTPPPPKENPLDSVKPILDKLKAPNAPDGAPARLGKEVVLDANEMAALQEVIDKAGAKFATNSDLANLQKIIMEQSKNTAFGVSKFFGAAIVEDNRISSPQVVAEQVGPKVHVPSELFRVWQASVSLNDARVSLEEYRTQGYKGKPAQYLAQYIEKGII